VYGKLFASMYDGTLYGNWQALVTFQQMIILADPEGVIDMTPHALAARTSIPLEIIAAGIEHLEKPDPYSRTPDDEGRRLERLDEHRPWGWRIVNHAKYKLMISAEQKREADRERLRLKRATKSDGTRQPATTSDKSPNVANESDKTADVAKINGLSPSVANVAHSYSDADSEEKTYVESEHSTPVATVFSHWTATWRHPGAKLDAKRTRIIKAALKLYPPETLCKSITGYLKSPHHTGKNDRNTVYDDLDVLLRDAKHIEAGLRFGDSGGDWT
jgi:hypothetical protein